MNGSHFSQSEAALYAWLRELDSCRDSFGRGMILDQVFCITCELPAPIQVPYLEGIWSKAIDGTVFPSWRDHLEYRIIDRLLELGTPHEGAIQALLPTWKRVWLHRRFADLVELYGSADKPHLVARDHRRAADQLLHPWRYEAASIALTVAIGYIAERARQRALSD